MTTPTKRPPKEFILESKPVRLVRAAIEGFREDEILTRAASLAFFTALSFAPLLVLLLYASALLRADGQLLVGELRGLIGPEAGASIDQILESSAERPDLGRISAWISIAVLIGSATGVFVELRNTLNHIWGAQPLPGKGWIVWVRTRVTSLAMLVSTGFLLVTSLVVTTAVHLIVPPDNPLGMLATHAASVFVLAAGFTALYRFVPAATVAFRDAVFGGLVTAALFTLGERGISIYIGTTGAGSTYGAAGSLVALLLWVYFSAVIVLFGAEITLAWAQTYGQGLRPRGSAERLPPQETLGSGAQPNTPAS